MDFPTNAQELSDFVAKRQAQMAKQLVEDIMSVLETAQGRRFWLWVVYDVCGLNKRGPTTQLERAQGRRDVACDLLDRLGRYPEILVSLERDRAEMSGQEATFNSLLKHLDEVRKGSNG